MKKSFFCLLTVTLLSATVNAQLGNTKWKGIMQLGGPVNVSFNFGKDTLTILNLDENSTIETMTYTATSSGFSLKKVSGQSDCDTNTIGKYSYQTKDNGIVLKVVEDKCDGRAPYLDNLKLDKSAL